MNFLSFVIRGLAAVVLLGVGSQALAARTTTYLHADGLGSVVAATNDAGAVLWRKDYAPFGEQIDSTPDTERTAYTGKPHDEAIGLTYFGGRHFDPELARFASVDPVAFTEQNAMSFNRYMYVNDNPYKYVDPDGEFLNFAAKFVLDVGINMAFNYLTTGELNVTGALKESVLGIWNPIPGGKVGGKVLAMVMKKADNGVAKLADDAAKSLGANPFKGKTAKGIAEMLEKKGYVPKGPDPAAGRGTYVNPKTGRGYHIDASHPEPKGPHVGVHRPRGMRDTLDPRDYPMGNP